MAARQGLRLRTRTGHPDFLDLPWDQPLEDWDHPRMVEIVRGLHRHVVVFVDYDGALYACKQMPARLVAREHRVLRGMAEQGLPAVEVVGAIERGRELEDVLVTRFLDYSLPYRTVLAHQRQRGDADVSGLFSKLLDALVVLLARLHLAGFMWGDCSLSNTLFRRDAGELAAYVVDVETAEWHDRLSDGQRLADLDLTEHNIAGGLFDLQAELAVDGEGGAAAEAPDPVEVAEDLRRRYDALWAELTDVPELGPDQRYKLHQRVRRLNQLGFDVDEVELVGSGDGRRWQLRTTVTEQGHHRRRLHSLTGLDAQENQARSLLNDLADHRAAHEHRLGRAMAEPVAAHRWLLEVFEPVMDMIPAEQRGKLDPLEIFHEVIEHKWFLSEAAGRDVGVHEAAADYIDRVLARAPTERHVLDDVGYMGFG